MRAFFGISVPAAVAANLLALVPPIRGLRRVKGDKVHLTLHFVADAPADLAGRMDVEGLPRAFSLTPGRLILLPESGPVRIVAASVGGELAALRQVHAAVGAALGKLGQRVDAKPYLPHITLARAEPALPQQMRGQTPMEPRTAVTFAVESVELIESRAAGGGFDYVTLRTWVFRSA